MTLCDGIAAAIYIHVTFDPRPIAQGVSDGKGPWNMAGYSTAALDAELLLVCCSFSADSRKS